MAAWSNMLTRFGWNSARTSKSPFGAAFVYKMAGSRTSAGVSRNDADTPSTVLDLGTGSGAIAVSLALECPHAKVTATDVSRDALDMAAENAKRLGASVEFIQSNWYANLTGRKFDLIVANPPYIAHGDQHLSQGDLRFEPQLALLASVPWYGETM